MNKNKNKNFHYIITVMMSFRRNVLQCLTNKVLLYLYPPLLLLLFLCYMSCRSKLLNVNTNYLEVNSSIKPDAKSIYCYLFVLIMTSPDGTARRKAMRETWLSSSKANVKVAWKFFIGTKDLPITTIKALQQEQNDHSDLIFLTSHKESYQDLTKKLLKSLVWINLNVASKFVMKSDDDTFGCLSILLAEMGKQEHMKRIYWGYFKGVANVKKVGPWAEKKWFLCDHYLPYALGGGYIITPDLLDYIAKVSEWLQCYNSEDVSLGVWLAPVQLNRIHDIRFDTEYKSRGCSNNHIVSHKQSVEDMYEKHFQLLNNDKLCKVEKEVLYTYDYNWSVPPSQCCKRLPRKMFEVK